MTTNRKTDERQFGNYCALLKHIDDADQKNEEQNMDITVSALYVLFTFVFSIFAWKAKKRTNDALSKQARVSMFYKIVTTCACVRLDERAHSLVYCTSCPFHQLFVTASLLSHQNRLVLKCIDSVEWCVIFICMKIHVHIRKLNGWTLKGWTNRPARRLEIVDRQSEWFSCHHQRIHIVISTKSSTIHPPDEHQKNTLWIL